MRAMPRRRLAMLAMLAMLATALGPKVGSVRLIPSTNPFEQLICGLLTRGATQKVLGRRGAFQLRVLGFWVFTYFLLDLQ